MSERPIEMRMMPAPPGPFIRDRSLEPRGLGISRAAGISMLRRPTLADIVDGKARTSPDVALRIEMAFGVSMELLLRIQTSFEFAQARERAGEVDVQRCRDHPAPF